jgi:hypothetical protein
MMNPQAHLPFRDAQTPGRRRHIATRDFQYLDDELLLQPGERRFKGSGGRGVGGLGGLELGGKR